jgi:hypothetical protein
MATPQNFLDNLENLQLVVSVALEHARANREQFLKNGTNEQVRQAERSISRVRSLVEQLEKEFNFFETSMVQRRGQPM